MPQIKRRNPFKYKANKVVKQPKTSRTEMNPITRAFVVGAVVASRDGYGSAKGLADRMARTQPGLSALVRRVEERARDGGFDLWDPYTYCTSSAMALRLSRFNELRHHFHSGEANEHLAR